MMGATAMKRFRMWIMMAILAVTGQTGFAQEWTPVTQDLLKEAKPGYGGLCGVVVDRATGEVIVNVSDRGLYRSTDQGKTWAPLGKPFKGRTEWPGCLMLDPTGGKKLISALVYGAPILVSTDRGETATFLDKKSAHVDWFAADWAGGQFYLTLKHESGDLLLVSRDGGKSFDEVGKGYGPAWIFDDKTAVVAQAKSKTNPAPKLLRTTDAAKTFEPVGDYHAKALPQWYDGALYWLVDGALLRTKDQGKTWEKRGAIKDGRMGPIFGKSADHVLVLTGAGVVESRDGGATWGKAIAPPREMKGVSTLSWLAYDASHDTIYVMKMTSELYRLSRSSK
jgi:hypothetical protein